MSAAQLSSKLEETSLHLTARCGGLLEVSDLQSSASFRTIRWMHQTAYEFVRGCKIWTTIINDDCFRDPSVCFLLMKGSLMSIRQAGKLALSMTSSNGVDSRTPELARTRQHELAHNAMVYSHYADGNLPTRTKRIKLLEGLEEFHLGIETATLCSLSDFVEHILSRVERPQILATSLLRALCSNDRLSTWHPYPTRRILECLIRKGNFAPRLVSNMTNAEDWAKLPAVVGDFIMDVDLNRSLHYHEAYGLIESQLSIIEIFLTAGIDPTETLAYLPSNFVLRKQEIQGTVEQSLQKISDGGRLCVILVLDKIKIALIDEARRQIHDATFMKKRKEAIVLSDDSDSDDVIFVEERPVDSRKRAKLKQDY
ncbi:hypothetical protein N431DRAFT_464214 [Stipitochalara longipes BDJ]|nr:hypothetical protein N431DRAFT_464214 [Stipitochalara longipes BDJ]